MLEKRRSSSFAAVVESNHAVPEYPAKTLTTPYLTREKVNFNFQVGNS